jgi:hypothetical protein
MVAEAGLEPARPNGHGILSPERLPIPPLGHTSVLISVTVPGTANQNLRVTYFTNSSQDVPRGSHNCF